MREIRELITLLTNCVNDRCDNCELVGIINCQDVLTREALETLVRLIPAGAREACDYSCTSCIQYDHINHNCPKFCGVIKSTISEVKENFKEKLDRQNKAIANCQNFLNEKGYYINFFGEIREGNL